MTTIAGRLNATKGLSKHQLEQFIEQGYCLVHQAFAREEAAEASTDCGKKQRPKPGLIPINPRHGRAGIYISEKVSLIYPFVKSLILHARVRLLMMYWARDVGIH